MLWAFGGEVEEGALIPFVSENIPGPGCSNLFPGQRLWECHLLAERPGWVALGKTLPFPGAPPTLGPHGTLCLCTPHPVKRLGKITVLLTCKPGNRLEQVWWCLGEPRKSSAAVSRDVKMFFS